MTTVTINDITIHYQSSGSGPAIVLLHGLAEDHRSWAWAQTHLSGKIIYAVDLRGHGATTIGDGNGTLEQLGHDLIGFLETVTGPASVVGYSIGGTIALWATAERPDLIVHPIAVAASSVVGRAAVNFFAGRIAQLEAGEHNEFAAGLRSDTALQLVTEVDLDAVVAKRVGAVGNGEGYINAARAMMNMRGNPLTPRLAQIQTHVDIVGADGDVFCPRKAADIMVDALPDAAYHEVTDSGHLISVDQPDAYGTLLADLLRG